MAGNGYCLFSVSNTQAAAISVNGNPGNYSATFCLNGKGPLSCQLFDKLNYLGMPKHVYLGNYGNSPSVVLCSLNTSTGAIGSCGDSGGGIPAAYYSNGIAINSAGTTAYISGKTANTLYQCTISPTNGSFTSCTTTTITPPSGTYNGSYGMIAVSPANDWVYIGDGNEGRILACPVVNNVIGSDCVNTGATDVNTTISGIILNNAGTTAYFVSYSPATVTSCSVSGSTFSNCSSADTAGGNLLSSPGGVALNNTGTTLYVTDYGYGTVYGCDTSLSSCFLATSGIADVWGIALNATNTVAYLSNFSGSVYTCPIMPDGTFPTCTPNLAGTATTGIALGY